MSSTSSEMASSNGESSNGASGSVNYSPPLSDAQLRRIKVLDAFREDIEEKSAVLKVENADLKYKISRQAYLAEFFEKRVNQILLKKLEKKTAELGEVLAEEFVKIKLQYPNIRSLDDLDVPNEAQAQAQPEV